MSAAVRFTTVTTSNEVQEILELQARNLPHVLTPEVIASQGFVTVKHDAGVLQRMNDTAPAIIAKAEDRVIAYALMMPREFAADVPILQPLFQRLDTLAWHGTPLRHSDRWFVMGQICVAEGYRGRGIFDGLYRAMAAAYVDRYDFTVTEVAERNPRSLRAHARVGFETLLRYADPLSGEHWHVVALDLRRAAAT